MVGFTSSGSLTGGNALAPTRPNASEASGPDSAACLAARPSPGPFSVLLFQVLLNSLTRAQALGVGMRCVFCTMLWGLTWTRQLHNAQEAAAGIGGCCGLHSHLRSSRTWLCCLGSRIYILPIGDIWFLGFWPSCHCINTASFLTLLSLRAAVILLGPGL